MILVDDPAVGGVRSSVVDQDVEAAESFDGDVDAPLCGFLVDRVCTDADGAAL